MAFGPTRPDAGRSSAVDVPGYSLPFDPFAYGWDGDDNGWPVRDKTESKLRRAAIAWAKAATGREIGYYWPSAGALAAWDVAHGADPDAGEKNQRRAGIAEHAAMFCGQTEHVAEVDHNDDCGRAARADGPVGQSPA
jgi:hypothetical protein